MYPDDQVDYRSFLCHTTRLIDRFLDTGSVAKGKSTGRPCVATPDALNNVTQLVERKSPFPYVAYPSKWVNSH